MAQGGRWDPTYAKYYITHPIKCHDGQTVCFKCEQQVYYIKECPKKKQGVEIQAIEPNHHLLLHNTGLNLRYTPDTGRG